MSRHYDTDDTASEWSDDSSVSSGPPSPLRGYTRSVASLGNGSLSSLSSTWSTSDSVSFVYQLHDEPVYGGWGYEGCVAGAVTRRVDRHTDPRVRFAAHFLSGPFAQAPRRKKSHHHKHRHSSGRSNHGGGHGPPNARPPVVMMGGAGGPPPPPPGFNGPMPPDPRMNGPPPPPPPMPMGGPPPPPPGFDGGFIDLNAGRGPPPPPRPIDPVWGTGPQNHGGPPPPGVQVFE